MAMSKTDKTRPWRVKMMEHPREIHDHRNGKCEIADGTSTGGWTPEGQCHFDADWWRPEFRCGCKLCKAGYYGGRRNIIQGESRATRKVLLRKSWEHQ